MNVYTKKTFGSAQGKQNFLIPKILAGIITLAILLAILNIFQLQVRNSFYFISSPVTQILGKAGSNISSFFEPILKSGGLKKENENLKKENKDLLYEISLLKNTLKENQITQEFLKNTETDGFETVLASTIGIDTLNDFIIIDKGRYDGISENMPVVSSQKVVFGKVFKAYKNFSLVMLISNKNSVLSIKISNEDPLKTVYGSVKGSSNLSFYLDTVSSESEIKEGDTLVTSALEGIFPKDLLVGKIVSKDKNDLKPFQTAKVQPFFYLSNIEKLFVIKNYLR